MAHRIAGLAFALMIGSMAQAQLVKIALPFGSPTDFPNTASAGFEDLRIDGTPSYAYIGTLPPPTNAWKLWTMTGDTGIALNGSPFTSLNPPAPQGTRVGFVQTTGTMSTIYNFQPGTWRLRLKGAQRMQSAGVDHQVLRITVGGVEYGEFDFADETYTKHVTRPFTIDTAASLKVLIEGLNPDGGDNTAFIDAVHLDPIAEWNDPATWGGFVPTAMDMVEIPSGMKVAIKGLGNQAMMVDVAGELLVTDRDTSLSTESVMVMGNGALFECGRAETPFEQKFTLTLVGTFTTAQAKFLMADEGGRFELHGTPRKSWTRLDATASPGVGTTTITLAEPVDWQPGDEFVIAGSQFDPTLGDPVEGTSFPNYVNRAEVMKVQSVNGNVVTLDQSFAILAQNHYGGAPQAYSNPSSTQTWTLDQRAEVGLLTHNVRVEGDASSAAPPYFGGHIMVMGPMMGGAAGSGRLSNVELTRMGQKQVLGRYPMHWHMMLGSAVGQSMKNCSVHRTYNRAITVHGTEHVTVEGNVVYENLGHAIFLEDGSERFNVIKNNLAIYTVRPAEGEEMLLSDNELDELQNRTPASYWISNPNNEITGNVAGGTEGTGFWFIFPQSPTGLSAAEPYFAGLEPNEEPLGAFDGNSCHNSGSGFDVNDSVYFNNPNFPDHGIQTNVAWKPGGQTFLTNFTAYGCDVGIYAGLGGSDVYFDRAVLAENRENIRLAAYHTVQNSVVIARTTNIGFFGQAYGYVVYDGAGRLKDSHLVDFGQTPSWAILFGGAATLHPNHLFSGVTYSHGPLATVNAQNYANFVDAQGLPTQGCTGAQNPADPRKWGAIVRDLDGSIWGVPGSSLIGSHPMTHIDVPGANITPPNVPPTFAKLSSFRFGHLRIYHPNYSVSSLPDIVVKREDLGYPSAEFTNCFKIDIHKQCPVIVNGQFVYTVTWPVLPVATGNPSLHRVDVTLDDVATTDSTYVKLAALGAQPGLVVQFATPVAGFTELANATVPSYYVFGGALFLKFAGVNQLHNVKITWP